MPARGWTAALLKAMRHGATALTVAAVAAGTVACAQSNDAADPKPFVAATADHMLNAVQACEASKVDRMFDTSQLREMGWRQLRPPGGMPEGQSMFANRPSGASITIASNRDGADNGCIVIGWIDNRQAAETVRGLLAEKLELSLETETADRARAVADDWEYNFLFFAKPDATDQIRMIVIIAPPQPIDP